MTKSIETFRDLELAEPLLVALAEVGYEKPSPIQAACIPALLAGRDLLGEAQTGTGKTAAFALPVLSRLNLSIRDPQVLVLTPTRELAIQVAEAFQRYARQLPGFHVLPVYGGQGMVAQLRQLQRGAHVIVGTPGRVMDHINRKTLKLDSLRTVVLDEADEMLRMGFIEDVEWILTHTPSERQVVLFSATMPEPIRRVARRHMRTPEEVRIRERTTTVEAITQKFCQVSIAHKLDALTRILEVEDSLDAALVFVRTKTATTEIADKLEARGYAVAALNGDLTQPLRERVVEQLKSGRLDIVVATDVAARGLDVARITHVINYDIPSDTEAYVHRIGRTGRAGRSGTAILFVTSREMRMLGMIERATRQKIEPLALPSRAAVADRRVALFREQVEQVMAAEDLGFFREVVRDLQFNGGLDPDELAAALAFLAQRERPLQLPPAQGMDIADRPGAGGKRPGADKPRHGRDGVAEVRPAGKAYGASRPARASEQRAAPEAHPPSAAPDAPPARRAPAPPRELPDSGELVAYRIEVGRNHQAMPKDIVGAIANETGMAGRNIGRIELYDDYSTVELPADLPPDMLEIMRRARVRQRQLDIRALTPEEALEHAKPRLRHKARTGEGVASGKPGKWSKPASVSDRKASGKFFGTATGKPPGAAKSRVGKAGAADFGPAGRPSVKPTGKPTGKPRVKFVGKPPPRGKNKD
jgi:ATP-dependent RNA helicase DeaD